MPLDAYLRDNHKLPYEKAYGYVVEKDPTRTDPNIKEGSEAKSVPLYSEWMDLMWYQRSTTYGKYIVVFFFDVLATKSKKNPNGFGPLVFYDVRLPEIQSMIDAWSPGSEYLRNWAFGNKPATDLRQSYWDDKWSQYNHYEFARVSEKDRAERNQRIADEREAKRVQKEAETEKRRQERENARFERETRNREEAEARAEERERAKEEKAEARNRAKEEWEEQIQLEDYVKLRKYYESLSEGKMDFYFIGKRILLDIQDIFAINFNKRIFFRLLGPLSGETLSPKNYYKFKYFLKNVADVLAKNGGNTRAGIKGTKKIFSRLINSHNPIFRGKFGRDRYIIYQKLRKMVLDHFKEPDVKKAFYESNKADLNRKGEWNGEKWKKIDRPYDIELKEAMAEKKGVRFRGKKELAFTKAIKKGLRILKGIFFL